MMERAPFFIFGILLFSECLLAVVFPYAPRPPTQPKVNTAFKQNHCPRYYTRYDDGDALVVVLQKGQCEMIIDKYAIQESMSIEGQAVAGPNNKMSYIPTLKFRNLSPICPNLPYEYRGVRVVVQTAYNCQLTFAMRTFQVTSPRYSQPISVARPVIENMK